MFKEQYPVIVGQQYVKGKDKVVLVHAMKAYLRGGIAPLILDLGI
jgi:hypothetical protein